MNILPWHGPDAAASLAGNALCGWLLMAWGPHIFLVLAAVAVLGVLATFGAKAETG